MASLKKVFSFLHRLTGWLVIFLIQCYQICLSPYLPKSCRFTPSCSQYAVEAFKTFQFWYASYLTIRRILRCNPFGSCGDDPLPKPKHV